MLTATRVRGRLLYRGESADSKGFLASPSPDLLDPKTYSSYLAADYFQSLNRSFPVFKAHIGSPSLLTAAKWGRPHSVWPIEPFTFLWIKDSTLLWDDAWSFPQSMQTPHRKLSNW